MPAGPATRQPGSPPRRLWYGAGVANGWAASMRMARLQVGLAGSPALCAGPASHLTRCQDTARSSGTGVGAGDPEMKKERKIENAEVRALQIATFERGWQELRNPPDWLLHQSPEDDSSAWGPSLGSPRFPVSSSPSLLPQARWW
ncbi:uncharacterized protein LOC125093671 isoform X2 [Lutra lutra]|uniref:uncharacterized protein LOC125093671 isoform X2 n=1 Tax=Lutra lutra TaxID=9657 RepID=UPI001FD15451|nr:uncharacterized protein LOC125093671 isoform X2 [Lutra lutra]